MALKIQAIVALQEYFNGVMNRADHHAKNVNEIVLALVGGVIWKSTKEFEVRTYNEETANILWMFINEKKFCFKYDHKNDSILVCEDSHNGNIIYSFTNDTPLRDVKKFFESLG